MTNRKKIWVSDNGGELTPHQEWIIKFNHLYHDEFLTEAECYAQLGPEPEQSPRIVAVGDQDGITAVAAEFQEDLDALRLQDADAMAMQADYDATMRDASCRGQ